MTIDMESLCAMRARPGAMFLIAIMEGFFRATQWNM